MSGRLEADFVVVGAGAAGAVLAARLSEDPGVRVILIEAGGAARGPVFSVPLMTGLLLRASVANWGYRTEPEAELAGRRINWPRGKALGGSTAINGMVWRRGLPLDFDLWAQSGLAGWSWEQVEPWFRKAEGAGADAGASQGRDGPMRLSRGRLPNPLFDAWFAAARQLGLPENPDYNAAGSGTGAGRYDFAIQRGRRVSTASAYLAPASARPNLSVLTRAQALRVVLEGRRAVGVEIAREGSIATIRAGREVILSGGTVNSPQLLMLSGIGPADELGRHGLPVVADLPGVGKGLQDHLLVRVEHRALKPVTLDGLRRIDTAAIAFARAALFGTGPAATFPIEAGALLPSRPGLEGPDLQCSLLPALSSAALRLPGFGRALAPDRGHGFCATIYQMRPQSRGAIRLASADPAAHPLISPRYLSEPSDREVLRQGLKLLRDIFRQPAFDAYRGEELAPGASLRDDATLDAWIGEKAETVFHPTSTCRMGPDHDATAVLDGGFRVRGVEGLRVVDASAMPAVTSGNTMAPTIMMAERAAAMICG
jgi:choline dehydrogenase